MLPANLTTTGYLLSPLKALLGTQLQLLISCCDIRAPAWATTSWTLWSTFISASSLTPQIVILCLWSYCWLESALKKMISWMLIADFFNVIAVDLSPATSVAGTKQAGLWKFWRSFCASMSTSRSPFRLDLYHCTHWDIWVFKFLHAGWCCSIFRPWTTF